MGERANPAREGVGVLLSSEPTFVDRDIHVWRGASKSLSYPLTRQAADKPGEVFESLFRNGDNIRDDTRIAKLN